MKKRKTTNKQNYLMKTMKTMKTKIKTKTSIKTKTKTKKKMTKISFSVEKLQYIQETD